MILVTGATGFLGSKLIKELRVRKNKLQVLVRDIKNSQDLNKNELRRADLLNKKSLSKAVEDCEIIVHSAAIIDDSDKNIFKVNVEGTRQLIKLAEQKRVKQFIFISTALVNFKNLKTDYVESKRQAESIVKESRLNWTIIRPTQIYGFNDKKNLGPIINFIKKSPIVPIINGNFLLQPIHINDVVLVILSSIKNPLVYKNIYNLGGPQLLSLRETEEQIISVLGKTRLKLQVPVSVFRFLYKNKNFWPQFIKKSLLAIDRLNKTAFLNYTQAKKDLNFHPMSFQEGMKLIINNIA